MPGIARLASRLPRRRCESQGLAYVFHTSSPKHNEFVLAAQRAAKMSRKPGRKAALTAPTQQPRQLTWERERPQMCRSAQPRPGAPSALRLDCFQLHALSPAGPASICAGALLQLKFPLDEIALAQATSLRCKTQGIGLFWELSPGPLAP